MPSSLLRTGPASGPQVVLAHGAGAAMDSPFMETISDGLAGHGLQVVRFEFPYMRARREAGARRPPDRESILLEAWRDVLGELGNPGETVIGGKSMGGRMASMVADELGVRGLAVVGYPFHAPGRTDRPRIAHLAELRTPALIVQGTRDPFGSREEVEGYGLSPAVRVHWLTDGDHDLRAPRGTGMTQTALINGAAAAVADFVGSLA